jgi:hypothetical protein
MTLLRPQLALKGATIRQTSEPLLVVTLQPATKGAKGSAVERQPNPYRHPLAGIQVSLRYFFDPLHLIIDSTKEVKDHLFRRHAKALLWL